MNANFLFDVDAYTKRPRRYVVHPTRLSRHPDVEQALTRLKQTIESLPREKPRKRQAHF
jgi:hypothetical protein